MIGHESATAFPLGGGEMGERIRNAAWPIGGLGAPTSWPSTLRTMTGFMLDAGQPMFIAWGPDRVMLYNDAYIPVLGGNKHPHALGRPVADVWAEVWDQLQPLFDQVDAGQPVHMDDIRFLLDRKGSLDVAHFSFSYTPIRDDAGNVLGLFCACMETTDAVLAREQADQNRERLAQLFEQGPSFMALLLGAEHRFELANAAYLRLIDGRDVLGHTVAEVLQDAVDQGYLKLLDDVFQTGEAFSAKGAKYAVKASADGPVHERYVDFIYQPIRDTRGVITGVFVEGSDVTERTLAETQLKASEARLRDLNVDLERRVAERAFDRGRTWEITPDLMGVLDHSGTFENTNPAWQATLGWSADEIARTNCFDLMHADDRAASLAAFEQTKRDLNPLHFENRYRHVDGSYRWLAWIAIPQDGKFYCTARDITAAKIQARELAARTLERDRLWRNSRDLLLVVDAQGMMREVSPAATEILGWTREDMEGESLLRFIHPDDRMEAIAMVEQAIREPIATYVNRFVHKDGGHRWLSWVAAPAGDLIYAAGRHVTADKQREEALAKAEEALRQSQKMEAVGQLTGGLAHDFNNLLMSISGSLEMLQMRVAQGKFDTIDRYVTTAQNATKRAAALTHRLLAFSRRQTLDPKPTNVNRLVAEMEELIRRTVGPEVHLEVVGAGGLWSTLVDPNQLENALLNLCINARDAMPDGGRLTIETANKWFDDRSAAERDLDAGQYISLCVSDTGTGMTPEVAGRAFDPFFTTKPLGEGTGLGLSMVHGLARQSGGQVRIYSEPGKGTTLCIYLPRHHADSDAEVAATAPPQPDLQGAGQVVLVVDDEPTIRMLICEVLADAGYAAIEASDGPAGLKVLRSNARIDLLVTDVGLPGGMNGRQVADAGRALRPGLKVLFITGYAENAVVGNGHLDVGMQVVTKPFGIDTLGRKIRELIDS